MQLGQRFINDSPKLLIALGGQRRNLVQQQPAQYLQTSTPTVAPTATQPPPGAFNNATFVYDGDGGRVKSIFNNNATTTYFVGTHYEVTNPGVNQTITKYYYAGSQRIAMRTNGTLNYLLGDHLGSNSLITDSTGNKTNEQRYKAWGETRYTFGNEKTKYTYTGQFSYTADFGLYFYNARWYDPSLGRFAQADTIIPDGVQGLDRYAYVNNAPINYTDPSGHKFEECEGTGKTKKTSTGDLLDFTGYSDWEKQILQKLYDDGGPNAVYGVNYILANDIHITAGSGWQSGGGSRGAWYEGNNLIVLNSDADYKVGTMPDVWGLSLIIHEARHIEQSPSIAFSKFGEMDGWQIGIDVAEHLGYYDDGWNKRDLAVKGAQTIDEFSQAIQQNDLGYWNALTKSLPTSITNNICIGLCSLPDWPIEIPTYQPPIWIGQ